VRKSVQAPERHVRALMAEWNDNPKPFIWAKTGD
jgi:hypothetical protein